MNIVLFGLNVGTGFKEVLTNLDIHDIISKFQVTYYFQCLNKPKKTLQCF